MKRNLLLTASAGVLSFCALAAIPAFAQPDVDVEANLWLGGKAKADDGSNAANNSSTINSTKVDSSYENEAEKGSNAANNGGTVTNDESDNSVDNSIEAEKGGKIALGSNFASKGGVNGNSDESDNSVWANAEKGSNAINGGGAINASDASGAGSANNGGTSNYAYSNVISKSKLGGFVTGNYVAYYVPANGGKGSSNEAEKWSEANSVGAGGAGGSPIIDNSISLDNGAMSNFAGLNAQNLNTGVGALQNASINVSASVGTLNLGQ